MSHRFLLLGLLVFTLSLATERPLWGMEPGHYRWPPHAEQPLGPPAAGLDRPLPVVHAASAAPFAAVVARDRGVQRAHSVLVAGSLALLPIAVWQYILSGHSFLR